MHHTNVVYCAHPLLSHHLTVLRDKQVGPEIFRQTLKRVTQFVLYEATKNLKLIRRQTQTPLGPCATETLAEVKIIVTPILRAGLYMADVMLDLIPTAHVYHLGLYRDEESLQPVVYYNKLTKVLATTPKQIFLLDPMLATGGSVGAAIQIFKQNGFAECDIILACILASPQGIAHIQTTYPNVTIYVGALDETLNNKGYILPGLGDAGDRMFSTHESS